MLHHAFTFKWAAATPYTLATILMPVFLGSYIMAVLVQLPRTGFYRMALLPVVFWLAFRACMSLDFSGNHPRYVYLNQGLALSMFSIAMRCTSWVLARQPYSRTLVCKSDDNMTRYHNGDTPTQSHASLSSAMWNACHLLLDLRGISWDGPQKVHVPTAYLRTKSRLSFGLASLGCSICLWLVYDIMREVNVSLGRDTFGAAEGGTIFDPSLPPMQRYLKSSIVTLLTSVNAYLLISALYYLHAALFIIIFKQHPSEWPPLFGSPFFSTSLHNFWGERWHQLFYPVFVEVGGRPLEKYFGKIGFVMGAFTLSGILHEVGTRGMGRGAFTLPTMSFFLIQGVGIIMESAWKKATGKRVSGLVGWLWTFLWLLSWGNILIDSWGRSGLMGSAFIFENYRPSRLLLSWISAP